MGGLHCSTVCLRSHAKRGTTGLSLKKTGREREVGGLHCSAVSLSVCLRSHTEKRHNRLKSKKREEKRRGDGEREAQQV